MSYTVNRHVSREANLKNYGFEKQAFVSGTANIGTSVQYILKNGVWMLLDVCNTQRGTCTKTSGTALANTKGDYRETAAVLEPHNVRQ